MEHFEQVVTQRWIPILTEYERIKQRVTPRGFRLVKDLYHAHHTSKKEILRYYHKWVTGGRRPEALLPERRGPKPGSRRTPKAIERNILKAYRRFGSNRYELVLLFKPHYLDQTPSPATMDRIKARYPLNPANKKVIKRYEKQAPGELAHVDLSRLPKDLKVSFKIRYAYVAALCDDCTRLTYAELLRDKKASTVSFFMARAFSWFKQIYNFEFEAVLSDNGGEFRGSLAHDHPVETLCQELGLRHTLTAPYHPQSNGKIEAFWKIIKREFFSPNRFDSLEDLAHNLGNFLFEFNHLRRHGGLTYMTPFDKLEKVTELLS
jgi:hypothetical protein